MPVALVPPDRAALWSRLALTTVQLAALSGATPRQIQHWTRRGYLAAAGGDRYDGCAIDRAVLIKQGLGQGLSLRLAVRLADAFLAARPPEAAAIAPASLAASLARLRSARADLAAALALVEPQAYS